ncbi:gibberellin receptor [Dionaea muscipula]
MAGLAASLSLRIKPVSSDGVTPVLPIPLQVAPYMMIGVCDAVVVSVNYGRAPEGEPNDTLGWVNSRKWLRSNDSESAYLLNQLVTVQVAI